VALDNDGFPNNIESSIGTDPKDACPDDPSDSAWPLDIDDNRDISVTGDVFQFRGRIGVKPGDPNWLQRLDLDGDGDISTIGDVFMYRGKIGKSCSN